MDIADYFRFCPYDGKPLVVDRDTEGGRPLCPRCGFVDYHNPRPCVALLIVEGGKVLLARRGVEPARGMWDIPGGFIDAGESAEEAVVREALEETGLYVQVTDFLGSLPDVYGDRRIPTLNLCFTAGVIRGTLRPLCDVEALSWFAPDRLPQPMAFAHQRAMLEWFRTRSQEAGQPSSFIN